MVNELDRVELGLSCTDVFRHFHARKGNEKIGTWKPDLDSILQRAFRHLSGKLC